MPTLPNAPVTGTDGHAPMYDPESRWQTWSYAEIYFGEDGENKYVPKLGDWVRDTSTTQLYEVTFLDPLTLVPTLVEVENGAGETALLVGPTADSYRVYLDTSVSPHVLAVDTRLKVAGSMSQYAKIYRGSDATVTGRIVGFLYNNNGTFNTDQIPLETIYVDAPATTEIKAVGICYTNENMRDGERVTVVIYNDQGHVVSKRSLIVENTSFIRLQSAGTKYISHIAIDSPFISNSDVNTLEYPINVPLQAFNMYGLVHYSDGEIMRLPIDGTKFKLLGLETFVSTVVGQEINLALSYALDLSEAVYGAISADGKYVTEPIKLVTLAQDGSYTVKLYAYPVWNTSTNEYVLQWYLMDLNRDILFSVGQYIYFNDNSDTFDPVAWDQVQNLSVRINLRDVSAGMKSYIHTQTVAVILKDVGTAPTTRWLVGFETGQSPFYGNNLFANIELVDANLWKVNISNGFANFSEWLEELYYNTKPLMDRKKEILPPTPTHIVFISGNTRTEYDISLWNTDLQVNGALDTLGTVFVEFIKRTSGGDLKLAIAGLSIKAV